MRELDLSQAFNPAEVKHDRIKVNVIARIQYPSAERMSEYLSLIGDISGYEHPVFRLQATRWAHLKSVRIADGWLFSGRGKMRNLAHANGGVAELDMELDLNPTRFLANHPSGLDLNELAALEAPEALRQSSCGEEARSASLTGTDNVLIGASRQGGTIFERRQEWWRRVVSIYLAQVRNLLTATLVPNASSALPHDVHAVVGLEAVAQAECYWEFETEDAIAAVKGLAEDLKTAAGISRVRTYLPSVQFIEEGQDGNSISVTLPLSETVHATIYAKTAERLRFEVKYLKDVRGAGARQFRGPLQVEQVIDALRENAALRIGTITGALAPLMTRCEPSPESLWDLFDGLVWAAGNDLRVARQAHSILMNCGAVSQGTEGSATSPEMLLRLVERKILRRIRVRHGGTPRYALTSRYAAVRRALKGVAGGGVN